MYSTKLRAMSNWNHYDEMVITKVISIVLVKLTVVKLRLKSDGFWVNYKCITVTAQQFTASFCVSNPLPFNHRKRNYQLCLSLESFRYWQLILSLWTYTNHLLRISCKVLTLWPQMAESIMYKVNLRVLNGYG